MRMRGIVGGPVVVGVVSIVVVNMAVVDGDDDIDDVGDGDGGVVVVAAIDVMIPGRCRKKASKDGAPPG